MTGFLMTSRVTIRCIYCLWRGDAVDEDACLVLYAEHETMCPGNSGGDVA